MRLFVNAHRPIDERTGNFRAICLFVLVILASQHGIAQEPPIASFDASAPEDQAGKAQPAPDQTQEKTTTGDSNAASEPVLSFSFRFAPWESVLVKFAEVAGLTLDLTEVPPGTFNYHDQGRYTPREALDVLNGYLLQRGFALVQRDRFLVCVSLAKGVPANLIPTVTVEQLADYGQNDLLRVILSNDKLDANLAAGQIEQLQGPQGSVVVLSATNSLLVTDTGNNLRLFNRLLQRGAFTRPASAAVGTGFQSFTLQHVRADEAERLVRTLFGLPAATSVAGTTTSVSGTAQSTALSITTDRRTNRLFVTGTNETLASIEQIVAAFDVAETADATAVTRGATVTRIVPLPNTDVIIVGQTLKSLSPRIHVSTTRSVHRTSASAAERNAEASTDEPQSPPAPRANSPGKETTPSPDGRDT